MTFTHRSESETTLLTTGHHPDTENLNVSTTLIETVAEAIGVDPTEENLQLDEYVDLAAVDQAYYSQDQGNCVTANFGYGDYHIEVCNCGSVNVSVNTAKFQSGEAESPASMGSDIRRQTSVRSSQASSPQTKPDFSHLKPKISEGKPPK